MPVTFQDIESAAERIRGHVVETPCTHSIPLSEITGMQIYCKIEYLQRTGSFKERGARNALTLLDAEKRRIEVIAASAGNHALGLAYRARFLGIPATVVMPRFAPLTKVVNCRKLNANVILHGADIGEARDRAMQLVQEKGLTYINGFDDPAIIAGQGTIGIEVARQVPDLDAIIVPIGGGGLIAGIALALRALKPGVRIISVEPKRAASWTATLFAWRTASHRHLGDALELGRSFVRAEYQRDPSALLLLWKGICAFVARHPHVRRLFGPVSVSAEYSSVARYLIAAWLTRECAGGLVQPRHEVPACPEIDALLASGIVRTVADLDALVREMEGGRGLPVLLRQYLRLNGRVLGVSCDRSFANAMDALLVVEMLDMPATHLERYCGRAGAARVRQYWGLRGTLRRGVPSKAPLPSLHGVS